MQKACRKGKHMKVTYIGHSGFAVELTHMILLFDYYTGELPDWPREKPLAVFASHGHSDHFNWRILRLAEQYRNVHYFFGNDIRLGEKWLEQKEISPAVKEHVTRMAGGRDSVWEDGAAYVKVHTLKSTDSGVAFIVETENKRIYHAGDLNWWHWTGEPEQENEEMGRAYRTEIDSIAGQHFDLAFVPLDPRLEESFSWGMDYFLEKTDSIRVFPMHMWGEYETAVRYKSTSAGKKYAGRVTEIDREGQEWNI